MWQYFRECYIKRRNFEILATLHIDGRILYLSGRVAAVRMEIIQPEDFIIGYIIETWLGKPLNSNNDNFVTRFLVAKG
jgi:hypothetical protein